MKIMNSEVNMSSTHDLYQEKQLSENMQFQTNGLTNSSNVEDSGLGTLFDIEDSLEISSQARLAKVNNCEEDAKDLLSPQDKAKLRLIKSLLEYLTGKEIRFSVPKLKNDHFDQEALKLNINSNGSSQSSPTWGFRYDRVETYIEKEQSSFSTQVQIKTADGREINASLQLNMSRSFISQNEIHIRAGNAIDPLVINFDAPAAALGERNFQFDLDADGQQDQVAFLSSGSGFLALDKNGDGTINDGSELFGPSTGDGFTELAAYDEDSNGWIDESDSVYKNLRIWTTDESGDKQLLALGQKGIGAIYLGHLSSPFSIKDTENNSLGEVRDTGFFVREDGTLGSVQQVDLVV